MVSRNKGTLEKLKMMYLCLSVELKNEETNKADEFPSAHFSQLTQLRIK